MSPSQAHDEAYQRSPAHDAMQVDFYKYMESLFEIRIVTVEQDDGRVFEYKADFIEAEASFIVNNAIIGFADIVQVLVSKDTDVRLIEIYELKPSIDTIGGLVRQCKVLHHQAERFFLKKRQIRVIPVVPYDDPALPDFWLLWGHLVAKWDVKAKRVHEVHS